MVCLVFLFSPKLSCHYEADFNISHHPLIQVSASATEAFFRYGGEPHFIFPTNLGPAGLSQGGVASPMQTPPPSNIASTYQTTPQTLTPQQGPGGGPGEKI